MSAEDKRRQLATSCERQISNALGGYVTQRKSEFNYQFHSHYTLRALSQASRAVTLVVM
jgi:hypothetical protein